MLELLKFSASWCQPCKMLGKIMEGEDLGVTVKEIDIDEQSELAQSYQIRGVPTLVLVKDGVEIKRKSGMMMLPELQSFVKE
jgi:thioredoxin 1